MALSLYTHTAYTHTPVPLIHHSQKGFIILKLIRGGIQRMGRNICYELFSFQRVSLPTGEKFYNTCKRQHEKLSTMLHQIVYSRTLFWGATPIRLVCFSPFFFGGDTKTRRRRRRRRRRHKKQEGAPLPPFQSSRPTNGRAPFQ